MKVLSKEVKTLYTIQFTVSEFAEILVEYHKSMEKHKFPRAFDWLPIDTDPSEWNVSEIRDILERKMFVSANGDTYSFIAEHFGFDGWSNAGIWRKNKQVWEMTVYDKGDLI